MIVVREYKEGRTKFLSADASYYSRKKGQPTTNMPVFYNPRMQLNRDISVLVLSTYLKKHAITTMCEPLAGSGVRTIRYLNECGGNFKAAMFDANPMAIDMIQQNISRNSIHERAWTRHGDAKTLLLTESRENRFDFVDIDPFGSPAPYINAALQATSEKGGFLALTATDMPVLCGVYPRVALRRYGGLSARTPFSHELAVRLLLGLVYNVAGMNDMSILPFFSLSTDHYVRVWLAVRTDRRMSNRQADEIGFISFCPSCMEILVTPIREAFTKGESVHLNEACNDIPRVAGPLWIGQLFDTRFVTDMKDISDLNHFQKKVPKILSLIQSEMEMATVPYQDIHSICDAYNLLPPKTIHVIHNLKEKGYRATRTHFCPTAIRSDAPVLEIVNTIIQLSEE